jgi:hypothetical protein
MCLFGPFSCEQEMVMMDDVVNGMKARRCPAAQEIRAGNTQILTFFCVQLSQSPLSTLAAYLSVKICSIIPFSFEVGCSM